MDSPEGMMGDSARDNAHRKLRVLEEIRANLKAHISTGKFASKELEQLEAQPQRH